MIIRLFRNTENVLVIWIFESADKEQAGLSWGSVQAETVRLQRQTEPGLMDILGWKKSVSKNLGYQNFWVQTKFGYSKNEWT